MKKFIIIIFLSTIAVPLNSQWVQIANGIGTDTYIYWLTVDGNNIFAGTNTGLYFSSNQGNNWSLTTLTLPVDGIAVSGNYIYAGIADVGNPKGVYISTNYGSSWTQSGLNNRTVYPIIIKGNVIFAATRSFGVYTSTNNGINWTQSSLNNITVYSLIVDVSRVYAGSENFGVLVTTNDGINWQQTSLNDRDIRSFAICNGNLFAGTYGNYGIYRSTNNGINWSQTSVNNTNVHGMTSYSNYVFAGLSPNGGVNVSGNSGINWLAVNQGFNPIPSLITQLVVLGNCLIAGSDKSVWRRPLSEVTGFQKLNSEIPLNYSLSQNYPNPFNPNTKIRFDIPNSGNVNISVYDVLGRKVAVIVDQQLTPGTYETDFDAGNLSSGIYYYHIAAHNEKITTEYYSETKKMIFIK